MTVLFTRKDYEDLPEGTPVELFDGLLVKQPSPRFGHQQLQSRILWALKQLLGPDRVIAAPVDVLIDEINVFVPDIVVLDDVPARDAQYVGIPCVVFEVLSPSTRDRDREYKTRRLLGLGVKEVRLIDGDERTIEVVTVDGGRVARDDRPARSDAIPGFELVPKDLFGP